MPKEEWGTKRLCPTTGKRFYDLNRDPIVSPYTGDVVTLDTGSKSRVAAVEKRADTAKTAKVEEEDAVLEEDDVLEEEDGDVDLGDDVLDDDDDDNVSLDELADVPAEDDE